MAAKKTRRTTKRTTKRPVKRARKTAKKTTRSAPKRRVKQQAKDILQEQEKVFQQLVSRNLATGGADNGAPSRGLIIGGFFVNLLITPGLGTLLFGNFSEGIIQTLISLIGLLVILMSGEWVVGLIILIISFIWSMISTISAHNDAV